MGWARWQRAVSPILARYLLHKKEVAMGMDLYGLKPNGSKPKSFPKTFENKDALEEHWKWQQETPGAYFRNNVWWWRPLWSYVVFTCQDILTQEDIEGGGNNGGHRITAKKAVTIGCRLLHTVEQGTAKRYEHEYMERLNALPMVDCSLCGGTGKRDDPIVKGQCNACEGKGKVTHFSTHYPFSAENVEEFARFCLKSGGFEIC